MSTTTLPLILSQEPVRGMRARTKASTTAIAVVFADAFGRVEISDGRRSLGSSQHGLSRYRTQYEVDISDHHRTAQLDSSPLPSRGDTYFFHSTVDVGFRVTNPLEVVRRNVTDALPVVYHYLIDIFRPVTRRYEITDAEGAETQLNLLFLQPVELKEGITIYRCHTRLRPDAAAEHYLRPLEAADKTFQVGSAQRHMTTAAARHEREIAELAQRARLAAEQRELDATSALPVNLRGLIQAHLEKHPDETAYALEVLKRHEEAQLATGDANDKHMLDLVGYMMEQGLIQAADVEVLRHQTLTRLQQMASPASEQEPTAGSWDDPISGKSPSTEPVVPSPGNRQIRHNPA